MDRIKRTFAVFVSLAALLYMFRGNAWARVTIDDAVVVTGRKVVLKAETKGKFFSKGGELVEFFVEEKSIGKTLSGGDGVAYKAFSPKRAGLHKTMVTSNEDDDTGLLLSVEKGSGIVFVDIEGSLFDGQFSRKPRGGSQTAVKEINQRFPVLFLHRGLFSAKGMKGWLQENEFIELPVVSWRKGAIFDEVAEEGLRVKAVIGAPKVLESARECASMSFSFEQVEGAEWIGNWEEINKKLK